MEGIRTVVTENSVWKFDTTLRRYIRFPRREAPEPGTLIPYTADWDAYVALERHGDRIIVHRPVPWGEGAMRMTGGIESDDLEPGDLAEQYEPTSQGTRDA
jgi:hypothetical protein